MNRILKAYLKRLTNLSTRNKSLLLTSLSTGQFLDLKEIDFLLGKDVFELIRQLIQRKERVAICDVQDPRFERVNEISKRLRRVSRTERLIEEERGSRDLYVGYPFVRGKLADGTLIHTPLLFFPVTLGIHKEQWCLSERDESGIILNRSFSLAYAHFNQTLIPDEVLEKTFEDFSKDALEFRTQLYEWLKETPFRINFNQQLFEDSISSFDAQKSNELSKIEKNGELKLYPEAVLGIFPQAGSYLVPDYDQLLALHNAAEMFLLQDENEVVAADGENVIRPSLKEEEILTPFSIDESQEEIIRAVKSGKSVVVQGPPGSGKSQLICNLMADFSSKGKRVLLVCQKRAALDVVYQRLKTIGMDPFVALIHDFKNDRASLFRQFAEQIESVEKYRQRNYGLDAVFLERQFLQESRTIDRTVNSLDTFRKALFDDHACGVSVKELYLTSDPEKPVVEVDHLYRSFSPDKWDDFRRRLKVFSKYSLLIDKKHVWHKRKNFAAFDLNDLRSMEKMLSDWPIAFEKQSRQFESITGWPFSTDFIKNRQEVSERSEDIRNLLSGREAVFQLFKEYLFSKVNCHERLAFIRQITNSFEGFIQEEGVEFSLKTSEIPAFRMLLNKAHKAKQSAVSGVWWDWFGGERKAVEVVAKRNGLTTSPEDLARLYVKVRNRVELEEWLQNAFAGFRESHLNQTLDAENQYLTFFQHAESAADAASRASFEPWFGMLSGMAKEAANVDAFDSKRNKLTDWLKSWDRIIQAMRPYLLDTQIDALIAEPADHSERLLSALRKDFDSIADMDRLETEMNEQEQKMAKLVISFSQKSGLSDSDEFVKVFENSVRLAWISHIENEYPDLRAVTSLKMQEWEEQLQVSITSKQKLSSDIVGISLRAKTYEDVEKNRLGNRTTYRELNHQVTKKRKIWPIRKLIENHQEEVFSLVPCWMASPEAVSAIFPMEAGLFDVVIFDEASQCYAEYGLPASYRGKQIVVTGDSKQLAPSDLYRVRYEEQPDEDEVQVALETESLLDLAAQKLEQYQLSGHYRSLSLDLIDFSNHHFYKDSLRLLPDYQKINQQQPGIDYVQVEGVWKNNTNLAEVEKVIEILKQISGSGKTIGVVTFNFYQQEAVQEAVERENIFANDLFVKNIENVQGDERDIIIFTMGYAPDEKGKLSMQFGSLNTQGGENRLNVAVTRAREKIYFVTSLLPAQLQTEQTANAGPKLLKAYLQYAFDVSAGNYQPKPRTTTAYRSNWLLKDRLAAENPAYKKELPFSDLTEKKEEVYTGLVLTDDDLYHQSKSSKEPHAYLPLLLKQKNWPFRRVYSRSYWSRTPES